MREYDAGERFCPVCGNQHGQEEQPPYALRCGTVLNEKYLIGKVIGQGGFGITYVGLDTVLNRKVAIKEYYPMSAGAVTRNGENSAEVVWNPTAVTRTSKEDGYNSFLKEARKMAKLDSIPGIVGVRDLFLENETAYIVMNYIEGETLKAKLQRDGTLSFTECIRMLAPIMESMDTLHRQGVVHRDISPDNIMVTPKGKVWLLDLGAAKEVDLRNPNREAAHSSQLVTKHGFSPPEQYLENGEINARTDVYAMGATIYYCVTGKLPPDAVDRLYNDKLVNAQPLTDAQFTALRGAMAIRQQDRPGSMAELLNRLRQTVSVPRVTPPQAVTPPQKPTPQEKASTGQKGAPKKEKEQKKAPKKNKFLIPGIAAALVLLVAIVGIIAAVSGSGDKGSISGSSSLSQHAGTHTIATGATEADGQTEPMTTVAAQPGIHTMNVFEDLSKVSYASRDVSGFWGQSDYTRNMVRTVIFHSTLSSAPSSGTWDISAAQDGSILAWMDAATLHAAAEGTIQLNPSSAWLFANFSSLTRIDFGSCVDTSAVRDMSHMFAECKSLTSLDTSFFNTASVTDMSYMFSGCNALTVLNVEGFNTAKVRDMRYMFANCSSLVQLDVSRFDTSRVTSMEEMFAYCGKLMGLDISGFRTDSVTNMNCMFACCFELKILDVSGFQTGKVTDMRQMFAFCRGLTALDVSGFDTSACTGMGWMFYGCEGLKELDLSHFDTSKVTDMEDMFHDCDALTSIHTNDAKLLQEFRNK